MTPSARFCLSYDPLKWDLYRSENEDNSVIKDIADSCVVSGITCMRLIVFTHVIILTL